MPVIIEACCGSAGDVLEAAAGGADRAELNAALELGGLTPGVGALLTAKERCDIPIMAMLRPRAGGFCYDRIDLAAMEADARALLAAGADGLVFGVLTPEGEVDRDACARLVGLAHGAGKQAVFHRALDVVPCWQRALDCLADLGVDRVLTSGQAASAPEGEQVLAAMVRHAAGRTEILPGGGVRMENAARLLRGTGCTQVHLSRREAFTDPSMPAGHAVRFNAVRMPPENEWKRTDRAYFAALRVMLSGLG